MTEENIQSKSRNDVLLFFIWQCIVSAFSVFYMHLADLANMYPDIWTWSLVKNLVTLFIFIFLTKNNLLILSIRKNLLILSIFIFIEFIIHKIQYSDTPFILCMISYFSLNYLPFLLLNLSKRISKYISNRYSINKEMYKYVFILTSLLLMDILIPIIIFNYIYVLNIRLFLMFGIALIILLSKVSPIIALIAGILLEKQEYYYKHVAPKLKYILMIGIPIDLYFFVYLFAVKSEGFSLKHLEVPFSFTLTFVPLYIAYLLDRLYKYLKNKFVK